MIATSGQHSLRTEIALAAFERLMPRRLALLFPVSWSTAVAGIASKIAFAWADAFLSEKPSEPLPLGQGPLPTAGFANTFASQITR